MSSREHKTSKGLKEKASSCQGNRIIESIECSKSGSWLYVSQHNQKRKTAGKERTVYKDKDLVKHGRNLPGYLQCDGKSAHTQNKTFSFGVLDWSRLENWKCNTKRAMETSLSGSTLALESGSPNLPTSINNRIPQLDQQAASNSCQLGSSTRRRLPKGARPKGKAVKVQVLDTVPEQTLDELQTSCSEDHSSDSKGKQAEQMITSLKETSLDNSRKYGSQISAHDSTKRLSEENVDHDDGHCFNEYEDVLFSLQENKSVSEHLTSDEECMIFDHDIGDPPFVKERHSSFSKRFSFSLEKMAKSISSKTRSALPQLSSTHKSLNSGPVTFRSSPDLLNYYLKKAHGANIVRSISMRWLVDPILKHKGRNLSEKVQQSTDLSYKKSPSVHAILQLKTKNEIPFFKLVVHSSSNILAAAVKKLPSGKDDSSLIYSFYSVHESKKNSKDWKNQDSTEKGHGFEYKILGHMKISSSYHAEFSGLERDLFVVRESVLYGPDCMQTVELAATIVKNTSKENYAGIGGSKSTVVILPGCNNHSLPNIGQPSSLVNRWRSGGLCDCGGWDIGCELGVLSKQNETSEVASASTSDRLELCYQGRNNEHDFSLVQLENGLYSLEYSASISLLQAFSICVAVVTSQQLTHIFQVNHLQDANNFTKPTMTKHRKVKSLSAVHAKKPPV